MENTNIENNVPVAQKGAYTTKQSIRWLWVSDALMFLALIGYYISVVCSFIEKRA